MPHPQAIHMAGGSVKLPCLKLRLLWAIASIRTGYPVPPGYGQPPPQPGTLCLYGSLKEKKDSIPMPGKKSSETRRPRTFFIRGSSIAELLFRDLAQIEQFCFALPSAPFAQLIRCRRMTTPSSMHRRRRWGKMPWDGRNEQLAPPGFIVVFVARVWYCCSF